MDTNKNIIKEGNVSYTVSHYIFALFKRAVSLFPTNSTHLFWQSFKQFISTSNNGNLYWTIYSGQYQVLNNLTSKQLFNVLHACGYFALQDINSNHSSVQQIFTYNTAARRVELVNNLNQMMSFHYSQKRCYKAQAYANCYNTSFDLNHNNYSLLFKNGQYSITIIDPTGDAKHNKSIEKLIRNYNELLKFLFTEDQHLSISSGNIELAIHLSNKPIEVYDYLEDKYYEDGIYVYVEEILHSSVFNIYIKNNNLVFNTNTTSLIALNEQQFCDIQKNSFDSFSNQEIKDLKRMGFINSFSNEFLELKKARAQKSTAPTNKYGLTILTTTNCNARCHYCYEKNIPHSNPSLETIELIKKNISTHSHQLINICWFGGEPLYNAKMIDAISKHMINNDIKFSSSIVTNGYLIDNWIDKFEMWKIKNVQITLDGVGEVYDKIKNYIYKSDISPFEKVIGNIKLLLDKNIRVAIRLNFDKTNYLEILHCIDYLYENFKNEKNFCVYANDIFGPQANYHLDDGTNIYLIVLSKLMDCGFVKSLSDLRIKHRDFFCYVNNPNHFVIDEAGNLLSCEHYVIDRNIGIIGSLKDGITNIKNYNFWASLKYPYKKCNSCKFLPMCQGGCKSESLECYTDSCCINYLDCIDKILTYYYNVKEKR